MKKSLIIIFLLFSPNVFSQYEILIDKYSTDEYTYPFIREGMKIQFLLNNNPSDVVVSEYNLESGKFIPIKAFYITEWFNNYNRDGYNWFFLRGDPFGEFSINYNPKTKKATFADKYSRYTQEFTFISGETSINNKVSSIRKKFFDEKFKNDKEIGNKLNEIINKRNIKSLPNYRNTINNDVFSNELKNKYLNILENKITSFNDSIISLFTIELENKKKESLFSHMKSLVEYGNLDSLQNKINDKFELDKPLSFINTEQFREYLVDFIINRLTDRKFFGISKGYESNAISFRLNIKLKEGKIKTNSSWGFLDGQTLDYNLSEDEKEQIETFTFFNISPQTQFINIEAETKLVKQNQTFIHNKKEPKTLYVNKNLLNADERSIFTGVIWKQNEIFFKKKSNDLVTITTKTFKSQKNQIKLNLDDTYGIIRSDFGLNLSQQMFENLNSYFNSADTNKKNWYFSDNKKIVNVYNEWVYELYIGNKKFNKNIKVKFTGLNPLKYLTRPTYLNKPFYTISVYQVY
jgi:hypothetical protein